MNTPPYITWRGILRHCRITVATVKNTLLTTIHFLAATSLVYHPPSSTCSLFLNLPTLLLWKNTRISTKLIVRAMASNSVLAPELFPYANYTASGSVLYYFFPPCFLIYFGIHKDSHSWCYDFVITQVVIRQSSDSTFIFGLRYKVYSGKAKLQF